MVLEAFLEVQVAVPELAHPLLLLLELAVAPELVWVRLVGSAAVLALVVVSAVLFVEIVLAIVLHSILGILPDPVRVSYRSAIQVFP